MCLVLHTKEFMRLKNRLVRAGVLTWVLAVTALAWPVLAADLPDPVVGLWQIINESTGKTDALVRIAAAGDKFEGRLETIYTKPGENPEPRCERCEGERRNQPIRGIVFMSDFVKKGGEYTNGNILDPSTGGVYSARLRLGENAEKLIVHGYIGIPLLGRSQTWLRARQPVQGQ